MDYIYPLDPSPKGWRQVFNLATLPGASVLRHRPLMFHFDNTHMRTSEEDNLFLKLIPKLQEQDQQTIFVSWPSRRTSLLTAKEKKRTTTTTTESNLLVRLRSLGGRLLGLLSLLLRLLSLLVG